MATEVTLPKGALDDWREIVGRARGSSQYLGIFDWELEVEVQTDKRLIKVMPCQFCKRPLVVTTFYVAAWAKCSPCRGEESGTRGKGTVEVVQAGRTDPSLAVDLRKTLINAEFATAICPVHPADEDHVMELKSVNHNDNYGPGFFNAKGAWTQTAPGETVMHQCSKCKAVVTYSTTAMFNFRRMNEPGNGKNVNTWAKILGTREEVES